MKTAFASIAMLASTVAPLAASTDVTGGPIRPLAQKHVVVGESPDAQRLPLYNPAILRLPSGRLVAGYALSNKFDKAYTKDLGMPLLTSDDGGATWTRRAVRRLSQARFVHANGVLYAIGGASKVSIVRSDDDGVTWSEPVSLAKDAGWQDHAANYIRANGNIYLVLEKYINPEIDGWRVGDLAPILMRAREDADLTKPGNWTFASELAFKDIIPGYRENDPRMDFFGVPFFPQKFPGKYDTASGNKPRRDFAPIGWLETNVVQITDPDHYWFDPRGKTFHLIARANTGGTGYAALAKVVENDDGSMTTMLEAAPSGKHTLFLPMPGGQMRFHITYDAKTKLYWLLGSQATDSMTRPEKLPADRFNLPNNERHRLVLHFSKNLVDWCFAGLVASTPSPRQARHYAAMDIDGDDLVILSRSGDSRARNAHDGNLITFHRVKNFRDLVY